EELNELTPANISALEAERNDARQSLVAVQRQFVENRTRKAESVSKLREAEAKLAKLVDSAKGLRDEVLEIKAEIASAQGGLNKHREHCSYWREKLGQREAQLTEANKVVEDLEAKLRDTIQSASQIASERVEPRADIKTLDTELNGVRIRISEIEKSQSMSMEEIAARAQTHIEAYEKAKAEIKNMVIFVKQLKEAYEERLARWGQFRDSMTVRVKMQFMSHLQLRGFTGKLEFDHIKQTLVPRVQTNQDLSAAQASRTGNSGGNAGGPRQSRSMTAHQRKDTRSLSGGERSFTTICLLLSLWEAMSCPIRALDEFDVFMDSANRRIAYFMMMQSARASAGTQFLLISPLDIDVNPAKDLRVLRLRPPDRQRTLTTQQEQ
ncbi:Structural maintenance of chromosomes protein 6, partial [Spiromyces aspiralis]